MNFNLPLVQLWPILSEVFWLGSLWAVSSRVFVFDRTYFSFCSRRLQGDVWSTTLFAGDAVGVWGDRTDCWSPYSHQSGYQGIRNSASRSGAQGPLGGELVGYPVEEYILGVLAIGSGLMLGREGPSIQLGAMGGKEVAHHLKVSPVEERSLIASGAAAGLAAAFNAPIAGLLFVVEEVYHHFSRSFGFRPWLSLTANFISLNVFGQTPVLHMPQNIPPLHLSQYWIYLFSRCLFRGSRVCL